MSTSFRHAKNTEVLQTEAELKRIWGYTNPTREQIQRLADAKTEKGAAQVLKEIAEGELWIPQLDNPYDFWINKSKAFLLQKNESKLKVSQKKDMGVKDFLKEPLRDESVPLTIVDSRGKEGRYTAEEKEVLVNLYDDGYRGEELLGEYNRRNKDRARNVKGASLERKARKFKKDEK
jgi:hypothetical protein